MSSTVDGRWSLRAVNMLSKDRKLAHFDAVDKSNIVTTFHYQRISLYRALDATTALMYYKCHQFNMTSAHEWNGATLQSIASKPHRSVRKYKSIPITL